MKNLTMAVLLMMPAVTWAQAPAAAPKMNMSAVRSVTMKMWNEASLTPEEKTKIEAAQATALQDPAVITAMANLAEARKEYQANQDKYPDDRDKVVGGRYRKAIQEAETSFKAAFLAADPTVTEIIDRPKGKKNEGENDTDSDTGNKAAVAPIEDVEGLPRVLLIGDSISIGYTLQVREKLKGKANVHRIPINGGATEVGLENMKGWLGGKKWDVIHFNFGLHDAKYKSENEMRATPEQYLKNLQELINQMKASGAKLIFATTTPTPSKLSRATRRFDSIPSRNEIAVKLMKENDVAIDDLYAVVLPVQDKIQRPGDVHFNPEGYEVLSTAVANSVEAELPKK